MHGFPSDPFERHSTRGARWCETAPFGREPILPQRLPAGHGGLPIAGGRTGVGARMCQPLPLQPRAAADRTPGGA